MCAVLNIARDFLAYEVGVPYVAGMSRPPANVSAGKLSPELEEELRDVSAEIKRGEYLELTPSQLDAWGQTGEFPWQDESHD